VLTFFFRRVITLLPFRDLKSGILVNSASTDSRLRHTADLFFHSEKIHLSVIFTPQHGLFGHTQANMIEWSGLALHPKYRVPVISLYAETREPTHAMTGLCDVLFIDLQDVGARYYTYIWTAVLAMKAFAQSGKKIVVLDRPNPINGEDIEGDVQEDDLTSFVGLYSVPVRHGMTMGEMLSYINTEHNIGADLEIVSCEGWDRRMFFDETSLPWVIPSPNMPTLDTAIVYPGQCLLEGTNLSEGRGTTRPFEFFGADFIDGELLAKKLNVLDLPGVYFSSCHVSADL
jgi:uncharacterized protein YbbC (DUF1343 family)